MSWIQTDALQTSGVRIIDGPFVIFCFVISKSQLRTRSSIGDIVELVDADLDDDNDDDAEQPSFAVDPYLFWINLAVKTSSSSSDSELFDAETANGCFNLPSSRNFCSNSSNCPMKFKFGEMIGRANLTMLYASSRLIDL